MNRQKLIDILSDSGNNNTIFLLADKVRYQNVGNEVHLRGLIEFSNVCKCGCKYCGLRSFNKIINRYRIPPNEIVELAQNAIKIGYKTIVLQSGEDNFYDTDKMCEIIRKIKKTDVALTLSIGEKSYEEYRAFKLAGADRYLLRIETTDEALYRKLHPNMDYKKRVQCLQDLKMLGYELGTGCLVGLPGQTIDSLADDIQFFKEINADMIGIGPFIPHQNTPLKNSTHGDLTLALKVMALTRIELPLINIPATTAMEVLHPDGRINALRSGANVIMQNVTSECYRSKYEIYPGKNSISSDTLSESRAKIINTLTSINRTVSSTSGNSLNFLGNQQTNTQL